RTEERPPRPCGREGVLGSHRRRESAVVVLATFVLITVMMLVAAGLVVGVGVGVGLAICGCGLLGGRLLRGGLVVGRLIGRGQRHRVDDAGGRDAPVRALGRGVVRRFRAEGVVL